MGGTVVCIGDKAAIETSLGKDSLLNVFKGYVIYRNSKNGDEYLGVWGKRNASRMQSLLKKNGLVLVLHRSAPPDARLKIRVTL